MTMEDLKDTVVSKKNDTYYSNLKIKIPRVCPHCTQAIAALTTQFMKFAYTTEQDLNVFGHRCPDCLNWFITTHKRKTKGAQGDQLDYVSVFPNNKKMTFHELIEKASPRFVEIYNQAYSSEQQGHYEIAGTGYRMALEILVKDFAINALNKDPEEVKEKKLFGALESYLDDQDALTSGDVVRVLGNDYAHYDKVYKDINFTELKWYLDMFVKRIEAKLLFLNPPVRTRQIQK